MMLDTSAMIFATAVSIICLYLVQTMMGLRFCHKSKSTLNQLDKASCLGFISRGSTEDWNGECGVCCPIIMRWICG